MSGQGWGELFFLNESLSTTIISKPLPFTVKQTRRNRLEDIRSSTVFKRVEWKYHEFRMCQDMFRTVLHVYT